MHLYNGIARRAAFPIYRKYKVNRFELWMLSALCGYLQHRGLTIVSKLEFFKHLSGNYRDRKKQEGYFWGLLSKHLIGQYEYITQPGSQSIGLSNLGVSCIRDYQASVAAFVERYGNYKRIGIVEAEPIKHRRTA